MIYNAEKIGKRIRDERTKAGLTLEQLGELLGKTTKEQRTGKQISIYENGKIPPIDILVKLCEIFNCELGYLLCEEDYSDKTKLNSLIEQELGISPELLIKIKRITGKEKDTIFDKYYVDSNKTIFEKMILSDGFDSFLDSLNYYSCILLKPEKMYEKICKDHGIEAVNKAIELINSSIDYEHETEPLHQLSKEEIKVIKEINKYYSYSEENHPMDCKVARYTALEECLKIIDDVIRK